MTHARKLWMVFHSLYQREQLLLLLVHREEGMLIILDMKYASSWHRVYLANQPFSGFSSASTTQTLDIFTLMVRISSKSSKHHCDETLVLFLRIPFYLMTLSYTTLPMVISMLLRMLFSRLPRRRRFMTRSWLSLKDTKLELVNVVFVLAVVKRYILLHLTFTADLG